MRTTMPLMIVVVLGVATLVWSLSGVGALYGLEDPVDRGESAEELEKRADQLPEGENGDGGLISRIRPGDDNFLGLIISGTKNIVQFVAMVALLPAELQRVFGLPAWFANPVGIAAQAIVAFGFMQFVVNRRFE